MASLTIFYLTSLIIALSTIGFGFAFIKFLKLDNLNLNYGIIGILGLFFLSIISSYTHLVVPHNYIHNITIIILGLLSYFIFVNKKINDIKILGLIFTILFICIILAKNNEDFAHYHLQSSLHFAQQKLQFGIGNLDHGFKHISSLFFLMSLNYLPFFEYYLFNLTNFLFLFFFIIFILQEIFYKKFFSSNLVRILLCFLLILFLTKFSRLAEYGSDISGQIIISYYIFFIAELIFNKNISFEKKILYLKVSLILIVFAISFKFILAIYSILILLLLYFINEKKRVILNLFNYKFLLAIFLPILFLIFFNFSSTGCLLYPVNSTCFSNTYDWAVPSEVVNYLNFYYELWAKAGAGAGYQLSDEKKYVQFLNWVPNWFKMYFFTKVSDFLLVTLFIIFVFGLFFMKRILKKKKKYTKLDNKHLVFFLSLIIIFLIWFFNFPTLRYAGYIIFYLLIIFPISVLLNSKINLSKKENLKKFSYIVIICFVFFIGKNTSRIYNEVLLTENEHHNFKNFPFYWVKNVDYKEVLIDGHKIYLTSDSCWNTPSTCVRHTQFKISKKNGYTFYSKK